MASLISHDKLQSPPLAMYGNCRSIQTEVPNHTKTIKQNTSLILKIIITVLNKYFIFS